MKLQEYKGYFVDYRLKQFRSNVPYPQEIEFMDFDSDKGDKLLAQMIRKGLADWSQLHL
jgi:hypothetical protein